MRGLQEALPKGGDFLLDIKKTHGGSWGLQGHTYVMYS